MGNACMPGNSTSKEREQRRRAKARSRLNSFGVQDHHQIHRNPQNTKINTLVVVASSIDHMPASNLISDHVGYSSSQKFMPNNTRIKIPLELSMRQNALIEKYWTEYIAKRHRSIFHKTMLNCIEASPKMNEIIACGRYCFRDLTKWPKLNRICQAQFAFYERLIFTLNLNEEKLLTECFKLGNTHAQYAQFGLKPHFLDIFQLQFIGLLRKIQVQQEDESEKEEMVQAYIILTNFVTEVMNHAYSLKISEIRSYGRMERRVNIHY